MTGFGEAYRQTEGVGVAVEVRTINSRYFKLVVRGPEGYAALEPRIEDVIRRTIRRGTIQVQFRVDKNTQRERVIVPGERIEAQLSSDHRAFSIKPAQ